MSLWMLDFDGVFVDSLPLLHPAFRQALPERHRERFAQAEAFVGLFEDNFYASIREFDLSEEELGSMQRALASASVRGMASLPPVEGMREAAARLGASERLYVVTSNSEVTVGAYLEHWKIRGVRRVLGKESGLSKIDKIAALRDAHPASRSIYIGDTCGDMREARAAGVVPWGVAWGWHAPAKLRSAGAEEIVTHPSAFVAESPAR